MLPPRGEVTFWVTVKFMLFFLLQTGTLTVYYRLRINSDGETLHMYISIVYVRYPSIQFLGGCSFFFVELPLMGTTLGDAGGWRREQNIFKDFALMYTKIEMCYIRSSSCSLVWGHC